MRANAARAARTFRPALAVLWALLALAPAAGAAAASPAPRTSEIEVEQEVMCPTCGTPLIVADSPLADRERAFIRARIARGETKEQIKRALVGEFGPGILASPPGEGFGLAAYLVPIAGVLLAIGGLSFGLRRWRRRRGSRGDDAAAAPLAPAISRQLDEDLALYDV